MKKLSLFIFIVFFSCISIKLKAQFAGPEFCDQVNDFNGGTGPATDLISAIEGAFGFFGVEIHIVPPLSPNTPGVDAMCNPGFKGSRDPNAKYGVGNNLDNVHTRLFSLPYSIVFENIISATASAAEVWVIDTLSSAKFDFSTFHFGSIQIGDSTLAPFEGNPFQNFSIINQRQLHGIDLKVEATFDILTGILRWHFSSLDTITYGIIQDPDRGFLPPNIDGIEGTGSVTYFIDRKNLPSGDSIHNVATIIFDANTPIQTQTWLVVVDTTRPNSYVNTLPINSPSFFQVSWSGSDIHAGILHYDIYVSENDSAFKLWLRSTVSTAAMYHGIAGTKYEFYSIATDRALNREFPPIEPSNSPDATTITLPAVLNLKVFIEGLYVSNEKMQPLLFNSNLSVDSTACDSIIVELHSQSDPDNIAFSKKTLMHTDGHVTILLPSSILSHSYYIAIRHRNALETWSKNAVLFNSDVTNFDFTSP